MDLAQFFFLCNFFGLTLLNQKIPTGTSYYLKTWTFVLKITVLSQAALCDEK
jgi:hypothetical protein